MTPDGKAFKTYEPNVDAIWDPLVADIASRDYPASRLCKPSGTLEAPLHMIWNYATIKTCGWSVFGVTGEHKNPCPNVAGQKLALDCSLSSIADGILMSERNVVRSNKPPSKQRHLEQHYLVPGRRRTSCMTFFRILETLWWLAMSRMMSPLRMQQKTVVRGLMATMDADPTILKTPRCRLNKPYNDVPLDISRSLT